MQRLVVQGRRRDIGLGSVNIVSLDDAREAALRFRRIARSGGDTIAERRKAIGSIISTETESQPRASQHLPIDLVPENNSNTLIIIYIIQI